MPASPEPGQTTTAQLRAGATISHYEVLERLGQGGMGIVWKARDTRLVRLVALKLLPPGRGDTPQARLRLLREARAASALNHPSIVTVYDILSVDGGDCIVMEYVEGDTLDAILRKGGLGFDKFFEIAIPLCDAVACAHSAGIIHRDLKPSNVMVRSDGGVKVLDFGLAKTVDASSFTSGGGMTAFEPTAVGVIMGTVSYMSPEQASGRTMDPRSDVFSLGIVLYQMLTGTNPFEAENTMSTLERVYSTQPASVTVFRQGTPSALEWCIDKALRKKPEDRYPDAGALRDELKRAAVELQHKASRVTTAMRAQSSPKSKRWMRWVPAVAGTLVLAGGGAWFARDSLLRGPTVSTSNQAPPIAQSASAFDLTRQGQGYLRNYNQPANVDRAIQMFNAAVQRDSKHAPAWAGLAEAFWLRYRDSPDKVLLNTAAGHAWKAVQLNPDLAVGHIWLGAVLVDSGQREQGLSEYRRAVELDPNNVDAYRLLGSGLSAVQRFEEAEKALRRAAQLGPDDWRAHNSLAVFLYGRGRLDEAIAAFERTRDLAKENPSVFKNLAAAYHMVGRDEDAASALQRSLEIQETANAYTNLGTLRFYQGRFAQAADAMERAIKLDANKHVMWGNLADAYRWTPDRAAKAPAAYDRAIELVRQRLETSPGDPDLRSSLANYLARQNRLAEALGEIAAALSGTRTKSDVLFKAATVYELAGQRDRALDLLQKSVELGYNWRQVENDPELVKLRRDSRFHLIAARRAPTSAKRR